MPINTGEERIGRGSLQGLCRLHEPSETGTSVGLTSGLEPDGTANWVFEESFETYTGFRMRFSRGCTSATRTACCGSGQHAGAPARARPYVEDGIVKELPRQA